MTDEEIEESIVEILEDALDGVNQSPSGAEVVSIDRENGKVTVKFNLEIIEEDGFAGFLGY